MVELASFVIHLDQALNYPLKCAVFIPQLANFHLCDMKYQGESFIPHFFANVHQKTPLFPSPRSDRNGLFVRCFSQHQHHTAPHIHILEFALLQLSSYIRTARYWTATAITPSPFLPHILNPVCKQTRTGSLN